MCKATSQLVNALHDFVQVSTNMELQQIWKSTWNLMDFFLSKGCIFRELQLKFLTYLISWIADFLSRFLPQTLRLFTSKITNSPFFMPITTISPSGLYAAHLAGWPRFTLFSSFCINKSNSLIPPLEQTTKQMENFQTQSVKVTY